MICCNRKKITRVTKCTVRLCRSASPKLEKTRAAGLHLCRTTKMKMNPRFRFGWHPYQHKHHLKPHQRQYVRRLAAVGWQVSFLESEEAEGVVVDK